MVKKLSSEVVNPHYDPTRDLRVVDQTGFVDLAAANSMNSLPANLTASELSFNGIEDPNSIGLRPSDQFEAAQASKAIVDYVPHKKEE